MKFKKRTITIAVTASLFVGGIGASASIATWGGRQALTNVGKQFQQLVGATNKQTAKLRAKDNELTTAQNKILSLNSTISNLQTQGTKDTQKIAELESEKVALNKQITDLRAEITALQNGKSEVEAMAYKDAQTLQDDVNKAVNGLDPDVKADMKTINVDDYSLDK